MTLKRADPAVPISVAGMTAGAAYHAGELGNTSEVAEKLKLALEEI